MKPFGCDVWVLLRHKLLKILNDLVRVAGTFIGYKPPAGSQKYLVLVRGKVYASCKITFDEHPVLTHVPQVPVARSVLQAADHPVQISEPAASQSGDLAESLSGDKVSAGDELTDAALSLLSDAESWQSPLLHDPFQQRIVEDNSLFVLPQVLDELYAAVEIEKSNSHTHHLQRFLSQHLRREQQANRLQILTGELKKSAQSQLAVTSQLHRFNEFLLVALCKVQQLDYQSSSISEMACSLLFNNVTTNWASCVQIRHHCEQKCPTCHCCSVLVNLVTCSICPGQLR